MDTNGHDSIEQSLWFDCIQVLFTYGELRISDTQHLFERLPTVFHSLMYIQAFCLGM